MSNNDNKTNVIIDFGKQYTFGQMLDKLSEDSTLSFVCNGLLYFKRKDKLLISNYKDTIYDVAHAKPMPFDVETLNKTFYLTNIYISNIIYEINLSDVRSNLIEGKTIMLNLNDRTWIIAIEDKVVFLDYSQADDANEDNYKELFADDVLTSLFEGQWYVIDGEI
jgi:hypothetical protein